MPNGIGNGNAISLFSMPCSKHRDSPFGGTKPVRIMSAVFVLRRRISQQWQNLFLVQEGNNNAQLAHFKKDPLQEGITQGNFIHTTRNGIRHTHHFWHSRITIAYGMRIGFVSIHVSTLLKAFAASWRYCCSVRIFRPRSVDMMYFEIVPWFGVQHAS